MAMKQVDGVGVDHQQRHVRRLSMDIAGYGASQQWNPRLGIYVD